ncbi:MAG TPA: helix-turn-helix domain-containing protein [Actinocrinis sp.]|jgi:transcriptional regulator with XRE-family HTH domain
MYADTSMFGTRLRELRERAGLSQRRLARLVHVDHSVISRIESGLRRPVAGLARALDAVLADAGRATGDNDGDGELERLARAAGADSGAAGAQAVGASSGASASADRADLAEAAEYVLVPPPDTVHFVGRDAELAALRDFFDDSDALDADERAGAARVCVVSGMPGLGKTALAIRCANLLAGRFPDGCLFLDLQGFTPGREPLSAHDALGLLLADLGVPQEAVPTAEHGRAVRYRGVTLDRRLLIILDNAAAGAQIQPLLPSGGGCGVVVTSRNSLAALDDALHVALPVLGEADSTGLFRAAAEVEIASAAAVRRIVELCGGVPLAIRIIAARCRLDRALTPEGLADELAAQLSGAAAFPPPAATGRPARLDLGGGERSLGEAFDASFGLLSGPQRDLIAHLGLFPPAAADARAAAALVDAPAAATARTLEQLAAAGLLEPQGPERYRLHDLVAAYARTVADRELPPDRRRAALGRALRLFDTLGAHSEAEQIRALLQAEERPD